MDLGNRLILLLEEKNITRQEFADYLHINYSTANGYISNRRQPDYETLLRMAEYFNSSTDYLIGRTSIRHHRDSSSSLEESILINNYRGLSPSLRQTLVDISDCLYQSQRKK